MSLQSPTYEIAKANHRPMKRTAMKRRIKSSRVPYGTNSVSKKKGKKKRGGVRTWKQLVKDLDTLTSQIVRLRDGGRCVLFGINVNCSGSEKLQNGHIFGRRSHGARWDTEPDGNCHAQCANCNKKHNAHQWIYYRWYIDRFGQEAFDELYRRWAKGHKYTRLELQNLVPEFEAKLSELQGQI